MSTYVVGDIQGCRAELDHLLETVNFDAQQDVLWCVGDMVNRGPDNLGTVRLLMNLPHCRTVLGNHDLHFLAVATGARKQSRSDTLDDLLEAEDLGEIINWMRHLPLAYYDASQDLFMSHAGIPAIWTVEQALGLASEIEDVLQGDSFTKFLKQMYGNEPDTWDPELSGWARLRLITNYLTRMRYCTKYGQLNLTHKEQTRPAGFDPWFHFERPDKTTLLFGHWAALEGKTRKARFVALDTGCVWGRQLTALRLEDRQLFSVPALNQ